MGAYKRVLLKLSGESLGGPAGKGIDENWLAAYAEEVAELSLEYFPFLHIHLFAECMQHLNDTFANLWYLTQEYFQSYD